MQYMSEALNAVLALILLIIMVFVLLPLILQITYYVVKGKFRGKNSTVVFNKDMPSFTIIIPIYNEKAETLLSIVEDLVRQKYPKKLYEVIIVSDDEPNVFENIRDRVLAVIDSKLNINIVRRESRKGYKAGALNFALKISNKDYVIVLDADSRINETYLLNIADAILKRKCNVLMTRWEPSNVECSLLSEALSYTKKFLVETLFRKRYEILGYSGIAGSGFVIPKDLLVKIGGFCEKCLLEDVELGLRLLSKGYNVCFANDIYTLLEVPSTYYAYRLQQERWAYGAAQLLRMYWRRILRSKMGSARKIENILYLSQYFSSLSIVLLNIIIPVFTVLFGKSVIATSFIYSFMFLIAVLLLYSILFLKYMRGLLSFIRALRILGRSAGLTFMLAPILAISSIKGLANLPFKWHVTPKGYYRVRGFKFAYELVFSIITTAITLYMLMVYGLSAISLWYLAQLAAIIYWANMLFRGKI
ncbi:MAG: glycosyltransferase [Thermoprotei archaeon]|nr:glycosyltransferase [Thermoprotei archaeon]